MRIPLTAALLLAASCVSTPDVEGVIQGPPATSEEPGSAPAESSILPDRTPVLEPTEFTREELRREATARIEALDTRCRELLPAAQAGGASYEALMEASRALIFNADLRIQTDVALRFDPNDLPTTSTLIDAEDDVSSDLKGEVRSLAKESRDLAERASELRPDDPAAELFTTLGIGLSLWSMGPLQALTNGATTTLPKRIKAIAESHPEFEGASPLRLKGRFASRAPWPYKDKKAGVEALERAVEVAPIPLNLLFLGDAYWVNDQEQAALAAWERGTQAVADLETEIASPFLREICRLRILSARKD
ncbi:hypothetical protein Poly30_40180 [Planctomycetes bacterium Poly30]|uniref:Tetratricopeptide repeat protein n=1 Tax=Saltatorellus ferox TaxID=2528018 RepID=A0A518EWP2_9BACT|nr:hypothetical protein Poly30_40180 [Planctomycetes bacterium Poly30]